MKKIIISLVLLFPFMAISQEAKKPLSESTTIRRVSVGAEIYQDFWMNWPQKMNVRAINQGASTFITYNIPFGNSPVSFAIGAGVGWHNLHSNTVIDYIKADTITFSRIPDSIGYSKSKFSITTLDFPVELRFVANNKIRFSVGVKLGYLIDAKTKFKGEDANGFEYVSKLKQVDNVSKFQFGPVVRFGYNWFQIMGYYSITRLFDKNLGPELYPISVGITFMPF